MAWRQFAEDADLGNILVRRLCQEAASQKLSGVVQSDDVHTSQK